MAELVDWLHRESITRAATNTASSYVRQDHHLQHGSLKAHITNADRIRAMSDEELVEIMAHGNCGYCKIHDYCFSQKGVDCDEAWLDWLKSSAEEGE